MGIGNFENCLTEALKTAVILNHFHYSDSTSFYHFSIPLGAIFPDCGHFPGFPTFSSSVSSLYSYKSVLFRLTTAFFLMLEF
jgi:hypothetical protein